MNPNTIRRLNQLNQAFYTTTADDFDATRQQAWPGWMELLPYLNTPLTVLDVGCGNGRFGRFLHDHLIGDIHYHGLDSNPKLLDLARQALPPTAQLNLLDVLEAPLPSATYDVVVLFGVIHHIPGASNRLGLMHRLAHCVADGGLLAFACWRFYESSRLRQRIVPWPSDLKAEKHDYILDWRRGTNALRYCHYVDDAEHTALVAATGLVEVKRYDADQLNRYSILRSIEQS